MGTHRDLATSVRDVFIHLRSNPGHRNKQKSLQEAANRVIRHWDLEEQSLEQGERKR